MRMPFPGNSPPFGSARSPVSRACEAQIAVDEFFERSPFRAERAAVDGTFRIALNVHHRGLHVLSLIANSMNDNAAANGAIRAHAMSLCGAGNFQFFGNRCGRLKIEAQRGDSGSTAARQKSAP